MVQEIGGRGNWGNVEGNGLVRFYDRLMCFFSFVLSFVFSWPKDIITIPNFALNLFEYTITT